MCHHRQGRPNGPTHKRFGARNALLMSRRVPGCVQLAIGVGIGVGISQLIEYLNRRKRRHVLEPVTDRSDKVPLREMIETTTACIRTHLDGFKPDVGLVLGSGVGYLADDIMEPRIEIPFADIPYFPQSTFEDADKMKLVAGVLGGRRVITATYRAHYYEGYTIRDVAFPVRVMIALGVRNLLLTNAAGGVNEKLRVGDLVILKDHVNFTGHNPLRGKNLDEFGERFPDCSRVYDPQINAQILEVAARRDIASKVHEGVYWMFSGPSYETPAEVRLCRRMGGDVVGMSTVPEALIAAHQKVKVTGISLVTNYAAGGQDALTHEEVKKAADAAKEYYTPFLMDILPLLRNPREE